MGNSGLRLAACLIVFQLQVSLAHSAVRNVVSGYGADNSGATYATAKIQAAMDACQPGDTLLFPDGTYLLNDGLNLKSNDLTVIISRQALIKANTDHVWLRNRSHILNGENLRNLTITGGGAIDGGGLVYPRGDYDRPRPGRGIRISGSTRVTVRNLTVRNIPNFAVNFVNCTYVIADSLIIRGRGFADLKGSSDGLDLEGGNNITVTHCDIEVGDDALCLKSNEREHPLHDVVMRNNVLASTCNAWKIGTQTSGEVYNILAENITVNRHSNPGTGNPVPTGDCISAIAVESNDHARVHHVTVRNVTINSCYSPIYFDLQNRGEGPGSKMDNITIENVNCLKSVTQPIIFNWQCGMADKMKDITLSNITVRNTGSMAGAALRCMRGAYPDANQDGIANAYGLWARGVDGLKLKGLKLYDDGKSNRRKYVFDASVANLDTSAINEGVAVEPRKREPKRTVVRASDLSGDVFDAWGRYLVSRKGANGAVLFRKRDAAE